MFDHPNLYIAIDKNDNVFVSCGWSPRGPRIAKFSSNGEFLEEFVGSVDGQPIISLDVDETGNIFLSTLGNPVIEKYDAAWNYLGGCGYCGHPCHDEEVNNFVYPGYIAVNSRGDIYASVWGEFYCGLPYGHDPLPACPPADYHSQIKKYDANFNFVSRWYLDFVTAIAIDSEDNVFACSQRDWAMGFYKYDSSGNLLQMVAPNGPEDGKIWGPHSVTVDSEGNVYVGDQFNRIQKFAPPFRYNFEGFFSPIENEGVVNKANAGQTIPVKWRLTDMNGEPVSDPASFVSVTSYRIDCETLENLSTDDIEEYAGSSGLQYLGDGYWQFNWKTSKAYAGQCRIMKLTLNDNRSYTSSFTFK